MKCLDEGTLQAYLDHELSEVETGDAGGHVTSCADCRARLGALEASTARVRALLDLCPLDMPLRRRDPLPAVLKWSWSVAALVVLFFVGAGRIETPRPPVAVAKAVSPAPAQRVARAAPRHAPRPQPAANEFIPLDDADPIQMGMVIRVMLPVTGVAANDDVTEIPADVVIGEDGRARAIRFVY